MSDTTTQFFGLTNETFSNLMERNKTLEAENAELRAQHKALWDAVIAFANSSIVFAPGDMTAYSKLIATAICDPL